jgi:hypothetical protein
VEPKLSFQIYTTLYREADGGEVQISEKMLLLERENNVILRQLKATT